MPSKPIDTAIEKVESSRLTSGGISDSYTSLICVAMRKKATMILSLTSGENLCQTALRLARHYADGDQDVVERRVAAFLAHGGLSSRRRRVVDAGAVSTSGAKLAERALEPVTAACDRKRRIRRLRGRVWQRDSGRDSGANSAKAARGALGAL
eukprot:4892661-Prymnesium_polylepis.2